MENQFSTKDIKECIAEQAIAGKTISELMEEYIVSASFVYNALFDKGIKYNELLRGRKRKIREENFSRCLKLYEESGCMPENDAIKKILLTKEKPSVYRNMLHKYFKTGRYKTKPSTAIKRNAKNSQELIDELRKIILDRGYIPLLREIKKLSEYDHKEYIKFFGSFQTALKKAGARQLLKTMNRKATTIKQKQVLIDYLRQKSRELGRPPTKKEMDMDQVHSYFEYYKIFGGLRKSLRITGV